MLTGQCPEQSRGGPINYPTRRSGSQWCGWEYFHLGIDEAAPRAGAARRTATGRAGTYVRTRVEKKWTVTFIPTGGMSTPSLSRVDERGGFSAGHSGLSLLNRGEHVFTEIQAFALPHAAAEGKPELVQLKGELA